MKKILLFGLSRNSKIVANEIEKLKKYRIVGFIDPAIKKKVIKLNNRLIPNASSKFKNIVKEKDIYGVVTYGDNYKRKKVFFDVIKYNKRFKWEKIISKDTIIDKNTFIGNGTIIMPGCIINCFTKIGNLCLINTGSIIEHDNVFDDFSSTGPGVTTSGQVKLGELSHLGTASAVIHDIKIGKNTVLGASSVAIENLQDNCTYVGVPARKLKIKRQLGKKYL